jgi:hypothetical protein
MLIKFASTIEKVIIKQKRRKRWKTMKGKLYFQGRSRQEAELISLM